MEHHTVKETWRIDLTDDDVRHPHGHQFSVLFCSCRTGLGLSGTLIQHDEHDRVSIASIDGNGCCLPDRIVRRLLRGIFRAYRGTIGDAGCGIIDYVDLETFLTILFGKEAVQITGLLRNGNRTFGVDRTPQKQRRIATRPTGD